QRELDAMPGGHLGLKLPGDIEARHGSVAQHFQHRRFVFRGDYRPTEEFVVGRRNGLVAAVQSQLRVGWQGGGRHAFLRLESSRATFRTPARVWLRSSSVKNSETGKRTTCLTMSSACGQRPGLYSTSGASENGKSEPPKPCRRVKTS